MQDVAPFKLPTFKLIIVSKSDVVDDVELQVGQVCMMIFLGKN